MVMAMVMMMLQVDDEDDKKAGPMIRAHGGEDLLREICWETMLLLCLLYVLIVTTIIIFGLKTQKKNLGVSFGPHQRVTSTQRLRN